MGIIAGKFAKTGHVEVALSDKVQGMVEISCYSLRNDRTSFVVTMEDVKTAFKGFTGKGEEVIIISKVCRNPPGLGNVIAKMLTAGWFGDNTSTTNKACTLKFANGALNEFTYEHTSAGERVYFLSLFSLTREK